MPDGASAHKDGEHYYGGEPESVVEPTAKNAECSNAKIGDSDFILKGVASWPTDVFGDSITMEDMNECKPEGLGTDAINKQIGKYDVRPVCCAVLT
ncbi:MAG: hypothetical protein OCC45_11185 [Desulfotalea sp.]